MTGASTRTLRSCLVVGVLCGISTAGVTAPAYSDDAISDPKTWCREVAELIASDRVDMVSAKFEDGSRGAISASKSTDTMNTVKRFIEAGKVKAITFLAEKDYAEAYRREWYTIVVGFQPLFIRCSFIKYDESWKFTNFDFETDEDNAKLP